jgi:hypothetical protein
MYKLSTMAKYFLLYVLLSVSSCLAQPGPRWPVKGDIDLSSGFGDFREGGRFHKGLDIRTGGKTGREVESPVDGYIWRVRMSYYGSGKALYIKGDDGRLYICYHLSQLAKAIDDAVVREQLKQHRYTIDLYFPKDSLRVKQGDFVAYSGRTGTGAPHLHFEIRTDDNKPINPLSHGYKLADKTPPVFERLGIQLTDDHSLLPDGQRDVFLPCSPGGARGQYSLDTVLHFNAPFGLSIDGYDLMRPDGMRRAIYRLSLYIDDSLFYRSTLDTLNFDNDEFSLLEFDLQEAAQKRDHVRRLYKPVGDTLPRSIAPANGDAVYGDNGFQSEGRHHALIVGEDALGNRARLSFDFLWSDPGKPLFAVDSIVQHSSDSARFFLSPTVDLSPYKIDSLGVIQNFGDEWRRRPFEKGEFTKLKDGKIEYDYHGSWRRAFLKIGIYHDSGSLIADAPFNGILNAAGKPSEMKYEMVDGGILLELDAGATYAPEARIEFFSGDSLLGTVYPQPFTMKLHRVFVSASKQYRHITRIGWVLSRNPRAPLKFKDVDIYLVGDEDVEIPVDEFMKLTIAGTDMFSPQFIEVSSNPVYESGDLHLNSRHYEILPEVFACRRPFKLQLKLPTSDVYNKSSGICWLDEDKNTWVWLDNVYSNDSLSAESTGGGSFAAVFDYDPPVINDLRPSDKSRILDRTPRIMFTISDNLSGVYDDQDIIIKLDGNWMIPEYDPETGGCFADVREPLSLGSHHLGIQVRDRAGNEAEQYLNFVVRKGR